MSLPPRPIMSLFHRGSHKYATRAKFTHFQSTLLYSRKIHVIFLIMEGYFPRGSRSLEVHWKNLLIDRLLIWLMEGLNTTLKDLRWVLHNVNPDDFLQLAFWETREDSTGDISAVSPQCVRFEQTAGVEVWRHASVFLCMSWLRLFYCCLLHATQQCRFWNNFNCVQCDVILCIFRC